MGLDNKNTRHDFHKPFPSDPPAKAPEYSIEDQFPRSTSFHLRDDYQLPAPHPAATDNSYYPQASRPARYKDTHSPPSDLPDPRIPGRPMYEMESVTNRILIKKQIEDERSKRTKSYVTTLLLSLALGICLIGFTIFLTFFITKTCPASSAAEERPLTVTVTQQGSELTTVTTTETTTETTGQSLTTILSTVLETSTATITSVSTTVSTTTVTTSSSHSPLSSAQCSPSGFVSGDYLLRADNGRSAPVMISILEKEKGTTDLAINDSGYQEVAKSTIFECGDDGLLAFHAFCDRGTVGSGQNMKCF